MLNFKNFLIERNSNFSYSCLMFDLPFSFQKRIVDWSNENIKKEDLYKSKEYGIEEDPHITLLYGLLPKYQKKDIYQYIKNIKPVRIRFGKTSIFKNPQYDVLKLDIISNDIVKLNKDVKDNFEYRTDYPNYKPHCTLAYLKKGKGDKYKNKKFISNSINLKDLIFSHKDGRKFEFKL